MALDLDRLVHYVEVEKHRGEIVLEDEQSMIESGYGKRCITDSQGVFSAEERAKEAEDSVGKTSYYHKHYCNCEHWINFWIDGSSGTSNGIGTNDLCGV